MKFSTHSVMFDSDTKQVRNSYEYSRDSAGFGLIPLFHTGPESHELPRIAKYLDSWLKRTQFVKIVTESHSP